MPDGLSNMFKNTMVRDMVNEMYDRTGAGNGIKMSKSINEKYGYKLDDNRDGKIDRNEMVDALTNDKFILSLENQGDSDGHRAELGRRVSQKLVNLVDAEDGILGGQIRVSGNSIDSDSAARNLTNGNWVIGKQLGDADSARQAGYTVIELHRNQDGPKITNP
jgi:hypothetical protein